MKHRLLHVLAWLRLAPDPRGDHLACPECVWRDLERKFRRYEI